MSEQTSLESPTWFELTLRHKAWRPRQLRWMMRDLAGMRQPEQDHRTHLRATLEWVCRAQDACGTAPGNGCVANGWAFELGWLPANIDDTGWLIETCLPAADYLAWPALLDRAQAMLDALLVQPDGPSVGRIHGLIAGHTQMDHRECLTRAVQSGYALLDVALTSVAQQAQHAHTLATLGVLANDAVLITAGRRHLDAVLAQQTPCGWFAGAFAPASTQNLAGIIRCLIESAVQLEDERALTSGLRAANALRKSLSCSGTLSDAFDDGWMPNGSPISVAALTPLAAVWLRLSQLDHLTHKTHWQDAAGWALAWTKRCQRTKGHSLELRDALPSAVPIWRGPSAFRFETRSTKHFADALMMDMVGISIPPMTKMRLHP